MELERALSLIRGHPPSPKGRNRGNTSDEHHSSDKTIAALGQLAHVNEVLNADEQPIFIQHFVPWALDLLDGTSISMIASSREHQIRHGVLAVLKTIAANADPMKPFIERLMNSLLSVLDTDTEENAIVAIHVLIDLQKVHRASLESFAQMIIDYVLGAFERFSDTCEAVFEAAKKEEKAASSTRRGSIKSEYPLLKATSSFKVLIECPVMIVLLFQIHRQLINDNIGKFVPLVMQTLGITITQPDISFPAHLHGIDVLNHTSSLQTAYADYISAQVKTLSFLAYISRCYANLIRPHFPLIPINVIRLLNSCPPDSASARKELLVATRHILSTEIRQCFIPHLGELLDETLLLGDGYTSHYVLRPLALSMLADLVHHVRAEISLPVLLRIIQTYSKALHDPTLPVGVQTMSAKLLVNLADSVLVEDLGPLAERRGALMSIMYALISKFEWIAVVVNDMRGRPDPRHYAPFFDGGLDGARPVETDGIAMDPNRDNFRDFKFLMKTLIGGLKSILFALKTLPPREEALGGLFTLEEGLDFVELFKNGVRSFDLFRLADETSGAVSTTSSSTNSNTINAVMPDTLLNVVAVQSEEKEIYEQFAYLFTVLDAHLFQEVFSYHLSFLVEAMTGNHSLLIIPQYLLAIAGVSRNFAGLLIRHLMDRFDDLVSADLTTGAISLRLFKLLFLAVSVYPDENESVLQPHLTEIIMNCLKRHQHTPRSLNYFLLLRSLFRSIGGGRFDALYKEVLPLLSVILEELGKLPLTTQDPVLRELYVELCLTTPVRLSVLLPYLSHLMKPLVLALRSSPELVSQGLRTLELCIDNLTQDFLEPIVYPVLDELLDCLWGLLRPPPASQAHSHAAMRILGKMGGRSHRYLPLPKPQPYIEHPEDSRLIRLSLSWDDGNEAELPLDGLLLAAANVLAPTSTASSEQRARAFDLIAAAVRALFGQRASKALPRTLVPFESQSASISDNVAQRLAQLSLAEGGEQLSRPFCEQMLSALFRAATCHPELRERGTLFLHDFYTVMGAAIVSPETAGAPLLPPPDFFLEALIDIACWAPVGDAGEALWPLIMRIVERLHVVNQNCGVPLNESPVLSALMEKLVTACYRVPSSDKIYVVRLVNVVRGLEDLDLTWVWVYEVRLTRGILYAMKSLSPGHVSIFGAEMTEVLLRFLRLCNRQTKSDESESEELKTRRSQFFNQLVALLVSEVSNANSLVRSAVQGCFQLLADVTGSDVTELLLPLKDRLLAPIFTKPLRALPPGLQIGYVDAITYCLSLRPPLLEVNDELLRLLNEAIALSEADDAFLASKTNQIANAESILQLRLVCIRLLSTALGTAEFGLPKLQAMRNMVVAVFFKALYSHTQEVVEASRQALEQVMVNQHKLPKDLLQTALRPVLTNLAEAKRLTLPGLEGLRRVLELLTSYFKSEIGKKLLDHLAAWAEPKKALQDAAPKPLCESMEVRVITAILDIFHLLPPSGHVFVAELVSVVINLERLVLRGPSSPFRLPLHRLLTHYPEEAADHLMTNLGDPAVLSIFAHVVALPGSEVLIEALATRLDRVVHAYPRATTVGAACDLLRLLGRVLDCLEPAAALRLLQTLWDATLNRPNPVREARILFSMVADAVSKHAEKLPELSFLPIRIAQNSELACGAGLPSALRPVIQMGGENHVLAWKSFHCAAENSTGEKIQAIRLLLIPILQRMRQSKEGLPDSVVEIVVDALLNSKMHESHDTLMLAVEEIQLACLFQPLVENNSIKSSLQELLVTKALQNDPSVRFAAYCGIIESIGPNSESSATTLMALLPNLLKMPTSETRPVVRQALELFFTVVLPQATSADYDQISKQLETSLYRECYSTVLVSAIWQCISNLPPAQSEVLIKPLLPVLVSSFLRSAQAVYLIPESRSLPFDLIKLLAATPSLTFPSSHVYDAVATLAMKLLLSLAITEDPGSPLLARSIETLASFIKAFSNPGQAMPWTSLERLFASLASSTSQTTSSQPSGEVPPTPEEQIVPNQRSALRLISALLKHRTIQEREIDFIALAPTLAPIVRHSPSAICSELFEVLSMAMEQPTRLEALEGAALESILSGRLPAAALYIASRSAELQADERLHAALVKLLPKMTRDYLVRHEASLTGGNTADAEFHARNLVLPALQTLLYIKNEAVRGPLLISIGLLWERALDRTLLLFITDLFITVVESASPSSMMAQADAPIFTIKEITTVLLTPSRLEQLRADDILIDRYLDLVLAVYRCPGLRGSELTNRLEGSFLQGLARPSKRPDFMELLDQSIARPSALRLQYLLGGIRWVLGGGQMDWVPFLVCLLVRAVRESHLASPKPNSASPLHASGQQPSSEISEALHRLCEPTRAESILAFLDALLFHDSSLSRRLWLHLFPGLWSNMGRSDRDAISRALGKLLARHEGVTSMSPANPISTIVVAASSCVDPPSIPPHLLRYVAQSHKCWYSSLLLLESSHSTDDDAARVSSLIYNDLSETDMHYGVLRRYSTLAETVSALSFAEAQRWSLAQQTAEAAQEAARAGTLPYLEGELSTWESVWLDAAKKLQQWDLVTEVAKADSDAELNLECIWRLGDWLQSDTIGVAEGLLKTAAAPERPRAKFLESFLVLNTLREQGAERTSNRFQTVLEEAIQGSLQAWNLLPNFVSRTHAELLHMFQMFVEIQEAMTIYSGIAGGPTNPASLINRPQFLTDLKGLLSTWRERLPNRMDDLNVWSDLLAWRQHIFSALNAAFQAPAAAGAAPDGTTPASSAPPSHPFAYRGYHELAWLINKFSRVCRKSGLPEACLSFLNRIYTLPNIEIQDAFSKLREQTLCYLDLPADLPTPLEVINATNLNYFSSLQKAEFFTMKGLILSKLGMAEEANRVFAQAVQIDLNIGKGWAYWGQFNDQRFQQTHDITLAVSAINCYLQAATLFKITKARRYGARILWLLTFEDGAGSMAKSFELYNNDLPVWFWVNFIPQLLSSLARKEARLVRFLLIKLAKSFPQALYLPLRTAADEFRSQLGNQRISSCQKSSAPPSAEMQKEPAVDGAASVNQQSSQDLESNPGSSNATSGAGVTPSTSEPRRSPVDYTDDLLAILKTGYPLLSLSMENMVEHIVQRLRSTADEDLYRVIVTLLSEAFQQMMIRFNSAADGSTGNGMEPSLKRVSFMLGSSPYLASTYKKAFDDDFTIKSEQSLDDVIALLQAWRINLEHIIRRCPASFSLEGLSRFLAEFEHQRYDEVEVPGQYLLLRDNNNDFVKIERFEPVVDIVRRHGSSFRRISIRGANGSIYRFIVQNPSARQSRREEKIMQFFRSIKRGLKQNPNARRRGLEFVIPVIVSVSAHVRLIQDELDQISLEEVYESFCQQHSMGPDDVLMHYRDNFQNEVRRLGVQLRKGNVEVLNLRVDLFQQIGKALVPSDILTGYIRAISPSPEKFWLFRQTFARQYACSIFLSYIMALGHRYPHKIAFSRLTGTVISTEILPTLNPNGQITLVEAVPFRLTPNLQDFITPLVIEGVLVPALYSCAEVFYKQDSELCEFLPMIVRDELISWVLLNQPAKPRFATDSEGNTTAFRHDLEIIEQLGIDERQFLGRVIQNCELAMKRCQTLACIKESERASDAKTCAYQTILDLVSCATNPQKLALMDAHWHPWL